MKNLYLAAFILTLSLALLLLPISPQIDEAPCDVYDTATQSATALNSRGDVFVLSFHNDTAALSTSPVSHTLSRMSEQCPSVAAAHSLGVLCAKGAYMRYDMAGSSEPAYFFADLFCNVHKVSHEKRTTKTTTATSTPLNTSQLAIQTQVAAAFSDVPQMLAVVRCESHFRQFDRHGKPLLSPTDDVGVMQINIPTWGALAKLKHLDIYNSVSDNIAMGRIVYEKQGIGAWTCKA